MNLVVLLILTLLLFIVSYVVDAGQVILVDSNITRSFVDMEADFSPSVTTVETGVVYVAEPLNACRNLRNKPEQSPYGTSPLVLIIRGGCSFEYKVRNAQRSGFKAAIVYDNVDRNFLSAMGGDSDGIKIQAVFVMKRAGEMLKKYAGSEEMEVMLVPPNTEDSVWSLYASIALILSLAIFCVMVTCVFFYRYCSTIRNSTSQFNGMCRRTVKAMPSVTFTCAKIDNTTGFSCAICLEDYIVGDKLRVLPCSHKFHVACVDSWLISWRTFCPVCKRDARTTADEPLATESTPFLSSSIATSSLVCIDSPPLGSSVSFSPAHVSSSFIHQFVRSSPMNGSRISENLRRQASPLQSSSQRSHLSMKSSHSLGYSTMSPLNAMGMSPYRPYPSNASPGLFSSTNHLLSNYTANTFSHFASAHSLPD
ncbi:Receptor region, transmembrane domain-and RING domain-containing protein 3 [Arabidopsis thaliana]|uniref:Receptor homology region, transmembrane domain- and RING domain-containing protein 3 n=4 Tax=Arabidopsis TaxID=3701 RepID=RMR3_ARATH|nr:Protease-associated (PA) RING/U-box zinc finger family protein [Arabidopsis thaliana]F4I2Y3.1 RecName: Full=Receptor homology region, transmembrane domain- and RING domain-containing protein 3; Short=AtRMR3; Flags: Precursor [Arabidopsis thaliana]KAG7647245.1 Zinc finger RING-type [Arabidopsis thaliana x Arabidopsis arenosa]KAG7655216.1 Zinc finger RING-type [Arabidopsis suecica]AEE30268.1 Protease-associated (PA) RING/U-box zinc finger family protein [Arabidopsis thaliana]OAP18031.1 hypoth|eukprot:NP_173681.1 Protease-associated (PA) RING/U-box zinc finger family protein [Arabidopsis thaliana]